MDITESMILSLNQGLFSVLTFLPNLLAGIIILLIGIILGSIIQKLLISVLTPLKIEVYLKRYGI